MKKHKLILIPFLMLVLGSCANITAPTNLEIIGPSTLEVDQSIQLSVAVLPSNAVKDVTWKTENPEVAVVSDKGVVSGKREGLAKIIAVSKINTALSTFVDITVTDPNNVIENPVESVAINAPAKTTIKSGETLTLTKTVLPAEANQNVVWESSDKTVATVNNGVVLGLKEGTTAISVKSVENPAKSAQITIKVDDTDPSVVSSIAIESKNITLNFDDEHQLDAIALPETATNRSLKYEVTSGKNYLSVSSTGLLKAYDAAALDHDAEVTITSVSNAAVSVVVKVLITNTFNAFPVGEAQEKTITTVHQEAKALHLSGKGTAFSKEYSKVTGVYLFHTDNKIPVITDGTYILQLHSTDDKITNGMTEGKTYTYFGYPSQYLYKPGFEILDFASATALTGYEPLDEYENNPTMTQTALYALTREGNDRSIYQTFLRFEGYIIYRIDNNGKVILGLSDSPTRTMPTNNISTGHIQFYETINSWYSSPYFGFVTEADDPVKVSLNFMVTHYEPSVHTWKVIVPIETIQVI